MYYVYKKFLLCYFIFKRNNLSIVIDILKKCLYENCNLEKLNVN